MSKNAKHFSIVGVAIAIVTYLVYFILSTFFFELPEAASAEATIIDALFNGHYILIAFLFAIVVVPMVYSIAVFRQEEGDDTDAPHIHENTALEIAWTVLPIFLVIGFGVWGVSSYNQVIASEPDEVVIRVWGFKWDWQFYYPEHGNINDPALVLQEGVPIKLEMQSTDVIHAFWVPKFRVKQDVFPYDVENPDLSFGNIDYTPDDAFYEPQVIRFTPVKEGVYRVRCAEICGTNHYAMLANVFVLSPSNYQAWLDGEFLLPPDPNQGNSQIQDGVDTYLKELERFDINTGYTPPPDPFAAPEAGEDG